MAATAGTTVTVATQLDGLFKKIYADRLINLIPDNGILVKMIPFSERDSEGDSYNQPVVLSNEHGVTYAASGDGAFSLNSPEAMVTKNATLNGYQLLLRSAMDYETAFKASNSKKAFVKSTELLVENMLNSITKRLEIEMLYGQIGLAKTEDAYDLSDNSTLQLQITSATWATGIWSGAENAYINFYNGASIVGTAGSGTSLGTADMKIVSIDVDNKRITVSGDSTVLSTLSSLAQTSGTNLDIYFRNQYGKSMAGIDKILTNTGSLFGISAETYHMWKANTKSINGTLTATNFLKSLSAPYARGLDSNAVAICNPDVWAVNAAELAALQKYDFSYKTGKGKYGFEAITFFSQNGEIELMAHPFCKIGDVFVFPKDKMKRLGATDITFNNPAGNGRFFKELEDKAGFELRCYAAQAIFCETPARCLKLTGVTVS